MGDLWTLDGNPGNRGERPTDEKRRDADGRTDVDDANSIQYMRKELVLGHVEIVS